MKKACLFCNCALSESDYNSGCCHHCGGPVVEEPVVVEKCLAPVIEEEKDTESRNNRIIVFITKLVISIIIFSAVFLAPAILEPFGGFLGSIFGWGYDVSTGLLGDSQELWMILINFTLGFVVLGLAVVVEVVIGVIPGTIWGAMVLLPWLFDIDNNGQVVFLSFLAGVVGMIMALIMNL